jgi:methionyl-tRNA formyltransferase
MKIVLFGSNEFSIPFLEAIAKDVVLVVTTIDKASGRGNKVSLNPVKAFANNMSIDVLSVKKFNEDDVNLVHSYSPDVFVVVSYGKIIPSKVLKIVDCAINVHPSKLPLYRGAAPIERQIIDGVSESAVSIIKVINELDAGDIIISEPFKIMPSDTKGSVEKRLFEVSIPLLKKALDMIMSGKCTGKPQAGETTYARKISQDDEIINWGKDNLSIYNTVRALNPKPLAYTLLRGHVLKIVSAELDESEFECLPGTVCAVYNEGFSIKCGKGSLKVVEVIPEGRRRMLAKDFINGFRIKQGEKVGG